MKKTLICVLLLALLGSAGAFAQAGFPTKPVEFICPFGAGGNSDVTSRLFAQSAQDILGQPIVVINKTGAGGALGLITVSKSKPDGYTIGLAGTNLAMGRAVNPGIGYDPVADFTPVCNLITQAVFLCVRSDNPITSFEQFLAEARKNPGKITWGSSGTGGSTHFAGEYLRTTTKIDITNVPIREGLVKTLLGGHVDAIFVNTPDIVQHVKEGTIRALATTTLDRVPQLPDVPTVAEKGYPGFQVVSWNGVVAPPGTPRAAIDRLAAYYKQAGQDPALLEKITSLGMSLTYMGPDEYGVWIKNEYAKWSKVANDLGIRVQ